MEYLPNPHDRLFKETWGRKENAQSFLQQFLPDYLLSSIDLDSLEICKDSFVEEDLREYFSDLLYKTTLSGRHGYLYFLFEHKSHPEKRVALQLLSYQQGIWNLHLKQEPLPLPVVIAMVLYHGTQQWTAGNSLLHLFGETNERLLPNIPDFRYLL
jgi:predicted transposase/invertase (TIGR01784 family)